MTCKKMIHYYYFFFYFFFSTHLYLYASVCKESMITAHASIICYCLLSVCCVCRTQCNAQVLSQKELCNERVAAAKLEAEKKMQKLIHTPVSSQVGLAFLLSSEACERMQSH